MDRRERFVYHVGDLVPIDDRGSSGTLSIAEAFKSLVDVLSRNHKRKRKSKKKRKIHPSRYSRSDRLDHYASGTGLPPDLIPQRCPSGVGRGWGKGNDCYKLRKAKKLGYDVSGLLKGGKNGKKDDETKGKGKGKVEKKETETEKDKVKPPPPSRTKAKPKPKVSRAEHEGKLLSKAQFLRAHSTRATAFEKAQTKHTADLLKAHGKEQTRLDAKHAKELERHKAKLATGKPKKGETQAAFKQRHAAGLLALKLAHGAEKEGLRNKHGDEIQSLKGKLEEEHKKFYSKHEDVKKEFLSRLEQGITPPPPPPLPPPVVEPPKPEPTPEPEPESKVPPSFDRERYSRYAAQRAAELTPIAEAAKKEADRLRGEYMSIDAYTDARKKFEARDNYIMASAYHDKIELIRNRLLDYDNLQAKNPTLIPAGTIGARLGEYRKFSQPKLDAVLAQKGKLEEELKDHEVKVNNYRKEYYDLDSDVDNHKASVKGKKKDRERIISELEAKRDEVLAKKLAAQEELRKVRDKHRDEVVKILATDKPMDLDLRSHAERDANGKFDLIPLPPEQSTMMQRAHSFLTRLVRAGDSPISCNVAMIPRDEKEDRAQYSGHIRVSFHNDTSVHIHEMGHLLDDRHGIGSDKIGERCAEFLRYRIKDDEVKSYKELFPGSEYRDDERGAKDKFDQAFSEDKAYYVGKIYGGRTTEILSMGLQKLYQDPITFAEKDPEYFMFVCGIMDGSLV
jgi:hypothetical protein